ncbi:hypothetical protein I4U23_009967 [Adineta vaga]|nr:hypothetical protein I4U23_009967 [Adineta vaga]
MTSIGPLFDLNELNEEQQKKFQLVSTELKAKFQSYLEYKLNLSLKIPFNKEEEEEENEWNYELYRFLRARKWNIDHTIKSLYDMLQWRIDNQVDSILEDEKIIEKTELLRKILPNLNHGYTKINQPLYFEKSGIIFLDKILKLNCQRAKERSKQIGKHIGNLTIISDLYGCNMNIRKILSSFKQSLYIDENYYPERLSHMILINPPTIFPDIKNTLLQYIDSDQLPIKYGGTCQSCSNAPNCIPVFDWTQEKLNVK